MGGGKKVGKGLCWKKNYMLFLSLIEGDASSNVSARATWHALLFHHYHVLPGKAHIDASAHVQMSIDASWVSQLSLFDRSRAVLKGTR